jgi:hypothetical protein
MIMSVLRKLASESLPIVIEGSDEVDAVHILALGGHVEAVLADAVLTQTGWRNLGATVTNITRSGRQMLMHFPMI